MHRAVISGMLVFAACAGTQQPDSAEPDDPCLKKAQPLAFLFGDSTQEHIRRTLCEQKIAAEHEQERREEQQRQADEAAAIRLRMQQEEAARVAAAAAEAEAQAERDARAVELWTYQRALEYGTSNTCGDTWEEDRRYYESLREHVASAERDQAIAAIEKCRKNHVAKTRKAAPIVIADFRRAFAIAIEDAFDDANPYRKGALVTKIEGSTLNVRMKGSFEGRARHSQSEVDSWCEASEAMVFSRITLKNAHGTFSCTPSTWIGGSRTWADNILRADGAFDRLSKAPGTKPAPEPLPADDSETTVDE